VVLQWLLAFQDLGEVDGFSNLSSSRLLNVGMFHVLISEVHKLFFRKYPLAAWHFAYLAGMFPSILFSSDNLYL